MKGEMIIFALAAHGQGVSGGDRIFIEFAKRWCKHFPITLVVTDEGRQMCARFGLKENLKVKFSVFETSQYRSFGFLVNYLLKIIKSIIIAFSLKLSTEREVLIYSASEFWMDLIPGFILKMRYPKNAKWVASWFQTAPNPIRGFGENRRSKHRFKAFLYWLSQVSVKGLIEKKADYILVNNPEEKNNFPKNKTWGKVIVVLGAVDLEKINKFKKEKSGNRKKFDAVFQGRFHPQKGVLELIDIWETVCKFKASAKLAMIGDGPLMESVKQQISKKNMKKNITLFGYLFDGKEKYSVLSKSKLALHPSFFDSGGMASAEIMAFGVPIVGFDLSSYKYYYPEGMVKVKVGDLESFAQEIIKLLTDDRMRNKIGKLGQKMIVSDWSWEKRASEILKQINGYT